MSIAPTLDPPSWVATRAAAWNQLINSSPTRLNPESDADSAGGGRVFNFSGMTPASAANQLNRIQNATDLVASGGPGTNSVPLLKFVSDPEAFTNMDDQNRRIPTPGTVPNPGSTLETAPTPPTNPLNEPPVQVPGPQQQPSGPPTSLLDMPDTGGRPEGSAWDGKMLDGRPVKYVIPEGNGSNTVDLEITNPNGTIDRWRIASDGHGGTQHWHDDADGHSSYASRTDPNSNWYVQSFDPGASTSAAPSHDLEATATFSHVFTPSFDANGNRVGTDVGILNSFGFYDNNHVDNFGNLTMTTARPDGRGGVESNFVRQLDSNSWRFGTDGQIWEIGPDLRGHTTMGRNVQSDEGTHSLLISDGVLYDSFIARNDPELTKRGIRSYTQKFNDDGTSVLWSPNGPKILLGKDGKYQSTIKDLVDRRDFVQKGLQTGWDITKGIGSSLGNWASALASNFDFRPGLMATANPMNPAYQAAAAQHYERANDAIQAPLRLMIVDPAKTVGSYVYYKLGGALYGLGSAGDPITPSGRARTQLAIEQMNKAPSELETVLAASTFLFPESAAVRSGATAFHGADVALADLTAGGVKTLRTLPSFATSGYSSLRNLGGLTVGAFGKNLQQLSDYTTRGFESLSSMRNSISSGASSFSRLSERELPEFEYIRTLPERLDVWRDARVETLIESLGRFEVTIRTGRANIIDGIQNLRNAGFYDLVPEFLGLHEPMVLQQSITDLIHARFASTSSSSGTIFTPRFGAAVPRPIGDAGPYRPRVSQSHEVKFNRGKTERTRDKIDETIRQIEGQIAGVNKKTANELLKNMKTVSRKGSAQKKANKVYKEMILADELENALELQLRGELNGVKPEVYAREKMVQRTKGLAALHEQDIIAGGKDVIGLDVNGLPRMGDRYVNSSLGSQWEIRGLAKELKSYAEDLVSQGLGDHLLNVEWSLR